MRRIASPHLCALCHDPVALPERVFNQNYERKILPEGLYVPEVF